MLHPGPIRHRVRIGIEERQSPVLSDEIQSRPEMPSEVRLGQGLQDEVGDDEREEGIESVEFRTL